MIVACQDCERLLLHLHDHDHCYSKTPEDKNIYLENKKYTTTANLIRPSITFSQSITALETKFKDTFKVLKTSTGLRRLIQTHLHGVNAFAVLHRAHPEHAALVEEIVIKKFTMCRIGAELRIQNQKFRMSQHKTVSERKLSAFTA